MRQIAIYGKGGIGKSTVVANLTAALSEQGHKIMQVGCDPKHDSTRMLMGGKFIPTVLDTMRDVGEEKVTLDKILYTGYNGIKCVESGGPDPGVGCGGRGIITAIGLLEKLGGYHENPDFVFYDVLGDVVCGGFAMPIRQGYAKEIYLVVSGELMALYAANNICKAVRRFGERGQTALGGIICNSRNVENERELVEQFAKNIGSKLIEFVPRDNIVQRAEISKKTVIEFAPDSNQAQVYRSLAEKVAETREFDLPSPIEMEEIEGLMMEFEVVA
jgi:nitrogenase iron protein NifH